MKIAATLILAMNMVIANAQEIQSPTITVNSKTVEDVTEWTTYVENDSIHIEYKTMFCQPRIGFDKEIVVLRVTNKQSFKMAVSWHLNAHYGDQCNSCDYPDEYTFRLSVPANSSLEADCALDAMTELTIFSEFKDPGYKRDIHLTEFSLQNITLTY